MSIQDPKLSFKHKVFCKKVIEHHGNATKAYAAAYGLKNEGSARRAGSNLMQKWEIKMYIEQLLEEEWLNNSAIDLQLLHIVTQDKDFRLKLAWIKEYNKLRCRGGYGKSKEYRSERNNRPIF